MFREIYFLFVSGPCVVCLSSPPQLLVEPCGHFCICSDCASTREALYLYDGDGEVNHKSCPICKIADVTYRKIFF